MNVDKLLVEAGAYFGGDGINYDRFEPRKFAALVLATTPPQRTEPVIDKSAAKRIATVLGWTPPRTWVGLTLTQVKLLGEGVQEEAIKSGHSRDWVFYTHINEALKEKNK